jgi:hypothetical protein
MKLQRIVSSTDTSQTEFKLGPRRGFKLVIDERHRNYELTKVYGLLKNSAETNKEGLISISLASNPTKDFQSIELEYFVSMGDAKIIRV